MRTENAFLANFFLRALVVWTIAFFLGVGDAHAASLKCTFADGQGKALRNVEVRLSPKGTEAYQFEKADKNGQVAFRGLKGGSYELRAQIKGHMPLRREISVSDDQALALTLMTVKEFDDLELQANQDVRAGDFSKAISTYQTLLTAYPEDPSVHYNLARAYAGLLQGDKALAEADKAVELDPTFSSKKLEIRRFLLLQQGQKALQNLDFSKAVEILNSLVKVDPKNAQAYYGLALAYGHQQDYQHALGAIDKALELDPQNPTYSSVKKTLGSDAGGK